MKGPVSMPSIRRHRGGLTIESDVVGLNMCALDLAIFDNKGIPLPAWTTKDRSSVEGEVESRSEGSGGVSEEADLSH